MKQVNQWFDVKYQILFTVYRRWKYNPIRFLQGDIKVTKHEYITVVKRRWF